MLRYLYKYWCDLKRLVFTARVRKACVSCGEKLVVNNRSFINGRTHLGHHVNMNGLRICGDGEVHIGNYFHSGTECLILTQNHNYDTGDKIPYDSNDIYETVNIVNCVWFIRSRAGSSWSVPTRPMLRAPALPYPCSRSRWSSPSS